MKIADVSSFFGNEGGGIRTYLEAKANHLPKRGHETHVIVPGERQCSRQFGQAVLHELPGPPIGAGYRRFGSIRALRELLANIEPDIVEVASHYVLPAVIATRRAPYAVVGFYHSDFPDTYVGASLGRVSRRVGRLAAKAAMGWVRHCHKRYAATLVASGFIASKLSSAGVPRIERVGLGVDVSVFRPTQRRRSRPQVIYAGRLSRDKEVELVLDAWPAIAERTDGTLLVCGSGPLAGRVAELAATRADVTMRGFVRERSDLAELIGQSDAALVPGRFESFSLAAAEALACGVPVVASDQGGGAELVCRSKAGNVFAAGNAQSLASATSELVAEASDADPGELRRRAREFAEAELCWDAVCDRLMSVYQRAVTERPRC